MTSNPEASNPEASNPEASDALDDGGPADLIVPVPHASAGSALWRPATDSPGHPLAVLDGARVGDDVTLEAWLGLTNAVGATYFRLHLIGPDGARSADPVLAGLQNHGPFPGYNWVEVTWYEPLLLMTNGRGVEVPPGIEREIFAALAALVPPGGHLMAEYESPARAITARCLAQRVPPLATPLGALLASVGCGAALRDWYIPEGGREGPRKLQGFRAVSPGHERLRAAEMRTALERYLADKADRDWSVQAVARPLAQAALERLRGVLGEPPPGGNGTRLPSGPGPA